MKLQIAKSGCTGVRLSSGAATSAGVQAPKYSKPLLHPELAAPEDGRTPAVVSRRGFLGAGMTLAAAGVFAAKADDRSTSDPGPANAGLDAQNADTKWPPSTNSHNLVPTFKYPFL